MDNSNEKEVLLALLLVYNQGTEVVSVGDIAQRTGINRVAVLQELRTLETAHILRKAGQNAFAFNVDIDELRRYVLGLEKSGGSSRDLHSFDKAVTVEEIINSVWEAVLPDEEVTPEDLRTSIRERRKSVLERIDALEKEKKRSPLDELFDDIDAEPFSEDDEDIDDDTEIEIVDHAEFEKDEALRKLEESLSQVDTADLFTEDDFEEDGLEEDDMRGRGGEIDWDALLEDGSKSAQIIEEETKKTAEKRIRIVREDAERRLDILHRRMQMLNSPLGDFARGLGNNLFCSDGGIEVLLSDEYFPLRQVKVEQREDETVLTDCGLLAKFFGEGEFKSIVAPIDFMFASQGIRCEENGYALDIAGKSPAAALAAYKKALGDIQNISETIAKIYSAQFKKWLQAEHIFCDLMHEEGTETREGAIAALRGKASGIMNKNVASGLSYVDILVYLKEVTEEEFVDKRDKALA